MLDLSNFLAEMKSQGRKPEGAIWNRLSVMMQNVQDAVNQTANATGVDSTGFRSAPSPPQGINVKAANGVAHVTITDNSNRGRLLHYFVEADTNPAFPQPHVVQTSASRGAFIPLPGKTDTGGTQHWYFRSYSMEPGSERRSDHQVLGGAQVPTPVDVGGTTQLTPLPSTGSGTASTLGRQGGEGFGRDQNSILGAENPKQP